MSQMLDNNGPVYITTLDGRIIDRNDVESERNRAHRANHYNNIGHQLNLLYDDIQAGLFGGSAQTGKFAQYLKQIKDSYPVTKPAQPNNN